MGFLLLVVAAALLWVGAELFTDHAIDAAERLGVTTLAVGLVLAGAEPEELITAVSAALRGRGGIAAGDAFGANVTMLTLILGGAAVLRGVPVSERVRTYAVGAAALGAVAAALATDGTVAGWGGLLLVASYGVAVAVVWRREQRPPAIGELAERFEGGHEDRAPVGDRPGGDRRASPPWRAVGLAGVGIAVMASGGWLAVLAAERIVDALGQPDGAVGLTFVALATTAELIALLVAATRRDVAELAVAGIVGSVAYNATVTLGVAALVRPLATDGVVASAWTAALLPLAVVALAGRSGRIGRLPGAVLTGGYVAYLVLILA